jgi:hypothetical protein
MKTRYPMKIAGRLHPAQTEVRQATLEEVQKVRPMMLRNPSSLCVAVWFPGMSFPTLVAKDQVV